ncbi:unnamed protein product, partial [Musa hybrid cultivar]
LCSPPSSSPIPFFSAFALANSELQISIATSQQEKERTRRTAMALLGKIIGLRGGRGLKELRADQSITDELAIRKAEEAASRRYQAAKWMRQMDQGASETLPEKPTEEEFCLALRNGLILCNVLNRVNPGAVPKVVENPVITIQSTDAAAQSAIQYFENMLNFLVAVGDMKLLTFEASDLEKGGSSNKVVDCILCLKGFHEWKLAGGVGVWRYGGIVKITTLSQRLQSSFLGGGSSDEPADDYSLQNNQQFSEFLHLVAEATLEESKTSNALNILFDQFGIQLLKAFLAECGDAEDFPMVEMFIDLVLDQAVKEFHMSLASQKDQLSLLLKEALKGQNKTVTKAHLMEAVSKFLIRNTCDSSFSLMENREVKLENQQKQLETLKMSFHEIKNEVECSQKKWNEDFEKLECQVQGLKLNSSSYLKLLEENRLLYNQVQDLKGNIRVYCRVRPFLPKQSDRRSTVEHIGENGNIVIVDNNKQGKDARKIFAFNKVFGENTTQSEIFSDTQPLIRSVLDGYNVCIFAYGQTGSGKTYTMSGPDITAEETWGVNYRALNDLFEISQSRQGIISYEVTVQMIEIYNEQVRDLLVVDGSNRRYPFILLYIRNYSQLNGLNIPDASLVAVKCTKDVLELMKVGQGNRVVGATVLNERSSRSHSVLTIHVQGKELASGSKLRGCLHLVDLAGSERVDKSEVTGDRLKEAQHINRSLSALGDVISALAQKSSHIPYRNSKLTQVLQDSLGGQAKTLMFVHLNPEANAFGETISTLKFAERVASIELGAAQVNKEAGQVIELKEEISRLRTALESKESEVKQLKILTRQIAFEEQKTGIRSPSELIMKKPELSQQTMGKSRKHESRSCSSVKRRNPVRSSMFSDKEIDSRSPFTGGESCNSRNLRSPSPPIRRSLSTDRAAVMRRKTRIETLDERTPLKLQFSERASVDRSNATLSSVLTSESLSRCWDPQEIGNLRRLNSEQGDRKFKPTVYVRHGENQKINAENKPTAKNGELVGFQTSDTNSRVNEPAKKRSESENEYTLFECVNDRSQKLKKFQHNARTSAHVKPRAPVQAEEPLSNGKHLNRPPNSAAQNIKERTNAMASDMRSSKALPHAKFIL